MFSVESGIVELEEANVESDGFPKLTSDNDKIFVAVRIFSLGISTELHVYLAFDKNVLSLKPIFYIF